MHFHYKQSFWIWIDRERFQSANPWEVSFVSLLKTMRRGHVDSVCWFSNLFWEIFPWVLGFSPLTKDKHFDLICCDSDLKCHLVQPLCSAKSSETKKSYYDYNYYHHHHHYNPELDRHRIKLFIKMQGWHIFCWLLLQDGVPWQGGLYQQPNSCLFHAV